MAAQSTRVTPPRRRTPARPRNPSSAQAGEPKRKYIPGGPGGGGRWVDIGSAEYAEEMALHRVARNGSTGAGDGSLDTPLNGERVARSRSARATPSRPRRDRDKERNRRRPATAPRPRYSSAAAAAAASQASDGYKPREERSWEEFHPDLDIEAALRVFTADEVDGVNRDDMQLSLTRQATMNSSTFDEADASACGQHVHPSVAQLTGALSQPIETPKRKPGRPPRRPESMLTGLGSPPAPRILPLPTHNPKERLNLPKPSFKRIDTFAQYEQDRAVQVNYVDKSMANVGYQEGDLFDIPKHSLIRHVEGPYDDDMESALRLESDEKLPDPQSVAVGNVEYDMDEQDDRWLDAHNIHRKEDGVEPIKPSMFEITLTQIEREYHALEKRMLTREALLNTANPEMQGSPSQIHDTLKHTDPAQAPLRPSMASLRDLEMSLTRSVLSATMETVRMPMPLFSAMAVIWPFTKNVMESPLYPKASGSAESAKK